MGYCNCNERSRVAQSRCYTTDECCYNVNRNIKDRCRYNCEYTADNNVTTSCCKVQNNCCRRCRCCNMNCSQPCDECWCNWFPSPQPPCPPPHPPCPPKASPTCQNLHIGYEQVAPLLLGPTGSFPFNARFVGNGTEITGLDPVLLTGPHTYHIEWSGAVDLIDDTGKIVVDLLLDGNSVSGSANEYSCDAGCEGYVPISGGAIVNVPAGTHTLQLRYIVGQQGFNVKYMNMRIVQLC